MPRDHNWPRPKALNRSFELAVNSLDIKGKKDLISCAIMQTSEDVVNELGWETHQIDAVISFSNQKLPEFNFSTHRLDMADLGSFPYAITYFDRYISNYTCCLTVYVSKAIWID